MCASFGRLELGIFGTARMCALYKAYTGERAWKAIRDRIELPSYLSRFIIIVKSKPENKEQTSVNTPL
jgi:hypothetical protein